MILIFVIIHSMYQDFENITIGNGGKSKLPPKKTIIPKNHIDQRAIKIENETEQFSIKTIPKDLSREIMQARTTKKFTQKEMAMKLNVQPNVYNNIENGKSLYDPSTKKLIQNIEKQLGIKFTKK